MSRFYIGAEEFGDRHRVDFADFIGIVMGRSIVSSADWGEGRIELGLSGDAMLRISAMSHGVDVSVFTTTNRGETPPLMLELPEEARRLPLREVEKRLRALRTLHAAVHLVATGRTESLENALLRGTQDLDDLLDDDDQLLLESISPGSWAVTLWAKARHSYQSLLSVVAMVYTRGRDAALTKLEADARLKQLDVEEREFKLMTQKIDYCLGLEKKFKSTKSSEALRSLVEEHVRALLPASSPGEVSATTTRFLKLPPPKGKK